MYKISIIVCCYNSEKRLPKTLEYLSNLIFGSNEEIELIIVDNNSSDNTFSIAKHIWENLGNPYVIKVVKIIKNSKSIK